LWDVTPNILIVFVSAFLTGAVIKIMDDLLDQEVDRAQRKPNLVALVGNGVVPYAMLALMVAVVLRPTVAISLFCAAYAVGMGHDLRSTYPTRVQGWGEAAAVLVFSMMVAGFLVSTSAILLMLSIQIADNIVDDEPVPWPLSSLMGSGVGKTPASVCAALLWGIALTLTPLMGVAVLFAYILFFAFERWYKACI